MSAMTPTSGEYAMPPGTIRLRDMHDERRMLLHPIPTSSPDDPLNWSSPRKALHFGLVLFYVLFTFVILDIGGTAYEAWVEELGLSYHDYNVMNGMAWLGLAVGCVIFIPLVYKIGRRPIYLFSLALQFATAVWAAKAKSVGDLIGFNLVMGLGGAISETIVMITIGDLFFVHQYATMNGLFLFIQSTGAGLGPVASGYVVDSQGWRWMWWWCAIFLGASFVAVLFFFEESGFSALDYTDEVVHAEAVEAAEAAEASDVDKQAVLGNKTALSRSSSSPSIGAGAFAEKRSLRQRLALYTYNGASIRHSFYQPFLILFQTPAVAYTAITYGTVLGWNTIIVSVSSSYLFETPWNFSAAGVGLFSLSAYVGTVSGALVAPLNDRAILWLAKRNGGIYEPEMRLWPGIPGAFFAFAGILVFGFGMERGMHWIVPAVGWALYSVGFIVCGDVALSYLADSYQDVIGDSLVAVTVTRNVVSVIFSFCLTDWINGMGLLNMFILVAVLCLVILLLPVPLIFWGKKARINTIDSYRSFAVRQVGRRPDTFPEAVPATTSVVGAPSV